jgi:hypothetical protein
VSSPWTELVVLHNRHGGSPNRSQYSSFFFALLSCFFLSSCFCCCWCCSLFSSLTCLPLFPTSIYLSVSSTRYTLLSRWKILGLFRTTMHEPQLVSIHSRCWGSITRLKSRSRECLVFVVKSKIIVILHYSVSGLRIRSCRFWRFQMSTTVSR